MTLAQVTSKKNDDRLATLRCLADREDALLSTRSNLFLIWQSILMASQVAGQKSLGFAVSISVLGLISTAIWGYMSYYSHMVARNYRRLVREEERTRPKEDQIYSNAREHRHSIRVCGVSNNMCLAALFPIVWAAAWLVVLILAVVAR